MRLFLESTRAELRTLFAVLTSSLRAGFAYKSALVMSMLSAGFVFAIPMFIWDRVYSDGSGSSLLSGSELFPYLIVGGCLNFVLTSTTDFRIGQRIRTGLIANDLLRPVDFQLGQMARALSESLTNMVLVPPAAIVAYAFWGERMLPSGVLAGVGFVLSVALAFVISFSILYVFTQAFFVTHSGYGLVLARTAFHQTFSGLSAPLVLFPDTLRGLSEWLPFRHTIHTPASIYLGWLSGGAMWCALAEQLIWAASLLALGRILMRWSLRRMEIYGG